MTGQPSWELGIYFVLGAIKTLQMKVKHRPSVLHSWLMRWARGVRGDELHYVWSFPHGLRSAGCIPKCASLLMSADFTGQSYKKDLSSMLKFTYRKINWQRRLTASGLNECFPLYWWERPLSVVSERGPSGTLWAAHASGVPQRCDGVCLYEATWPWNWQWSSFHNIVKVTVMGICTRFHCNTEVR